MSRQKGISTPQQIQLSREELLTNHARFSILCGACHPELGTEIRARRVGTAAFCTAKETRLRSLASYRGIDSDCCLLTRSLAVVGQAGYASDVVAVVGLDAFGKNSEMAATMAHIAAVRLRLRSRHPGLGHSGTTKCHRQSPHVTASSPPFCPQKKRQRRPKMPPPA